MTFARSALYASDHDAAWYQVATQTAQRIVSNAQGPTGEFLKTWSGSSQVPDAATREIRTDASSVSVLAALAAVPAPSG